MLYLDGRSGTTYLYIHLNNDLTDGNDNRGRCVNGVAFPRGLHSGDRVAAGQLVGYVGDSGTPTACIRTCTSSATRTGGGHGPVSVSDRGAQAPLLCARRARRSR